MSVKNIPTHVVEIPDVDLQMFRLRLAGKSTRDIARALKISEDKVRATVESMQVPLTAQTKANMLLLELARLDIFQESQFDAASKGDRDAIDCSIAIMKHRADLAGLFAAANLRVDPIQLVAAAQPEETTTEQIQRVIDKIRGNFGPPKVEANSNVNGSPPEGEPSDAEPGPQTPKLKPAA